MPRIQSTDSNLRVARTSPLTGTLWHWPDSEASELRIPCPNSSWKSAISGHTGLRRIARVEFVFVFVPMGPVSGPWSPVQPVSDRLPWKVYAAKMWSRSRLRGRRKQAPCCELDEATSVASKVLAQPVLDLEVTELGVYNGPGLLKDYRIYGVSQLLTTISVQIWQSCN